MAIRTYTEPDGTKWRVWSVEPRGAQPQVLSKDYRNGWLCFECDDGNSRYRLPRETAPPDWESLSDDLLSLLRHEAIPTPQRTPMRLRAIEDETLKKDS